MCGIAGVLAFGPVDAASVADRVEAMLPVLRHRGPDGQGTWRAATSSGGAVALGHRRLAIIDLSSGGHQPMVRDHGAVTYNGEISNYPVLRDQLRDLGQAFTSTSDTEVVLRAYAQWGPSAVDHLDGMFAFGLWDTDRNRLVLARDRFGIKPLYYCRGPNHLVFASEIRALLAAGIVRAELDPDSLWHYVGHQTAPTPATLLRGVRMLEPGHVMEVRADGVESTRRYWSLLDRQCDAPGTPAATATRVGGLLRDAVASHIVSDVPIGVFLSGGIDSGAVVSTMHALGVRPRTFTVSLDEDVDADESDAARQTAEAFHCDHMFVRVRGDDVVERLPAILAAVDHPSGDGLNTFIVSEAVRRHGLKVALSGLGGDELFGGYPSFRQLTRLAGPAGTWRHSPAAVRRAAAALVRTAGSGRVLTEKAASALRTDGTLSELWPITRQLFAPDRRRELLSARLLPPREDDTWARLLANAFAAAPDAGARQLISYAETRCYMHDVLLRDTDQMAMAHGLEVRVPLLDHRLASYVASLPDSAKRGAAQPKALLLRSLERPLPSAISRQPKRGFTLPLDLWMRGPLREFCAAQLDARGLEGRGVLAGGSAAGLWSRFLARERGVTAGRVWPLVALNAWLDRHQVRVP